MACQSFVYVIFFVSQSLMFFASQYSFFGLPVFCLCDFFVTNTEGVCNSITNTSVCHSLILSPTGCPGRTEHHAGVFRVCGEVGDPGDGAAEHHPRDISNLPGKGLH